MAIIVSKHIKKAFLAVFILPLFIGGVVWAADSSNGLVIPNDPAASSKITDRIQQRKNSLALQLNQVKKKSIEHNCKVAQAGMQAIKTKDLTASQKRQDTYSELATKLATIIDHLERQSMNAANIKKAQSAFTKSINTYLEDYLTYKTALDDAIVMDCVKDPEGFYATLSSSRQYREKLNSRVKGIKTTLPNLVKSLDETKQTLIKKSGASSGEDS